MNLTPKVIAHRGGSSVAPENTLAAVAQGWAEHADGVECDVRLTSDGQVVCIHDADTARVADRNLVVEAHTFEELSQLDVGAKKAAEFKGERIPLLSELMAKVLPGKLLFIELKAGEALLTPLFEVIDAAPVKLDHIRIIVFDLEMVKAVKARRPDLKVYWLIDATSHWLKKLELEDVLETLIEENVEGLGLCCDPGINREMVKAILGADVDLNIWTVDDANDARRYATYGVTSISSNCPQAMLAAMSG
jgi:glycerophosphoryl diester phosphodiesterase